MHNTQFSKVYKVSWVIRNEKFVETKSVFFGIKVNAETFLKKITESLNILGYTQTPTISEILLED